MLHTPIRLEEKGGMGSSRAPCVQRDEDTKPRGSRFAGAGSGLLPCWETPSGTRRDGARPWGLGQRLHQWKRLCWVKSGGCGDGKAWDG